MKSTDSLDFVITGPSPEYDAIKAETEALLQKSDAEEAPAGEKTPTHAPALKPIEVWAVELNTPAWLFAAAKMHAGWPIGRHVTRDAYVAGVDGAKSVTCR